MKQEIKLRAWDEGNEVMHNDFQFIKSGEEGNDWVVFTSDKQKLSDTPHPFENPYSSQQLKITAFIGKTDKTDLELFKNDIVEDEKHNRGIIVFLNGEYWVEEIVTKWINSRAPQFEKWSELKKIGDAYQNPDLLKPDLGTKPKTDDSVKHESVGGC